MALDDFIMTIDSDAEDGVEVLRKHQNEKDTLNPEFTFDVTGDVYDEVLNGRDALGDLVKGSKREPVSVDDIIARRKLSNAAKKRKREAEPEEEEDEDDEDEDDEGLSDEDELSGSEEDEVDAEGEHADDLSEGNSEDELQDVEENSSDGSDSEEETQAEKDRKAAYFAVPEDPSASQQPSHTSFTTMSLSRPLLKAVTALGFSVPTPIQAATVPVALLGKDVVGNAVTGSGKTAAFMIPVLERLMYRERGKGKAAVRCVVLVPTRELGVQCAEVGRKLAAFMDVRISLIVGGLSLKSQESELRTRPDILVATPGRLIDHLRNSPSFALDTLDVLILDEADRMLSDGFADELKEIIGACPASRQTMLFSATMTDDVDALVRMTLNRPVRLFVDPKRTTARGSEAERTALLVALCKRTCKQGVLVFFRSKKLAHQMPRSCTGDLTQEQRLRALQLFRDGAVDFLMATDLASRGLDIKGIETVVNYDMPGQLSQYLHRVGRTGPSVTLVGEADRRMLKAAIKHSSDADKVRHRTIPLDQVSVWSERLAGIKDEITEPKRDKLSGLSRRVKRRKLAMEEDEGETAAVRAAAKEKKRKTGKVTGKKGVFDRDMGEKRKSGGATAKAREGVRANKTDKIGGMGKKGAKGAKGKGRR
ncbi:P-loop containing nucleoside triphosphate hydrolase protein [Phellopilus nigrolimitatus]|nr:P-loop containing nucleoside triphosphate hydrolase protein [Phellopilus nigrolimitatus]